MRPEKAYTIVRNVMMDFYEHHKTLPEDHRLLDREFIKAVDVCLRVSQKDQLKYAENESELTTKAYYEIGDISDVLSNMMYISDRWNCVGRLLYIKDVIDYVREF